MTSGLSDRITGAALRRAVGAAVSALGRRDVDDVWDRLAAQLDADAERIAELERERDEWKARASVHIPVDTKTRADAEQWRAFVAVVRNATEAK